MRIPSIGTPISAGSIVRGLGGGASVEQFREALREMTGRRFCILTGSGTTALYLILRALARISPGCREKLVLPAYTAPSLILAVKEAGIIPVLSEVSLETFNQDLREMETSIDTGTLAVMPVHMYGLVEDLSTLEEASRRRGVFVVEDAASAMGGMASGRPAGSMGDVSFFSFNRGKNLSTVAGGAVLTDRDDIAEAVKQEESELTSPDGTKRLHVFLKAVGLSLIWRPSFYSLLWPIACGYRYRTLHEEIELLTYTTFQASIGCSLMEKRESIFSWRHENGLFLREALEGCDHIRLPRHQPGSYNVLNQFPLCTDPLARRDLLNELENAGFEATTLYPLPIHRIYDLGLPDDPDPLPGATKIAKEILLLPVHQGVRRKDLERAVRIVTGGRWVRRSTDDSTEKY